MHSHDDFDCLIPDAYRVSITQIRYNKHSKSELHIFVSCVIHPDLGKGKKKPKLLDREYGDSIPSPIIAAVKKLSDKLTQVFHQFREDIAYSPQAHILTIESKSPLAQKRGYRRRVQASLLSLGGMSSTPGIECLGSGKTALPSAMEWPRLLEQGETPKLLQYIDDIIVWGNTAAEVFEKGKKIIQILLKASFALKQSKMELE
ncbi:hypothetical protein HGM15179_018937 [Zosterops borbonicus]|uniref:Reverse transcriptase domain-containing protein n=1 Tax=Zosterops borbonicus TaxID=364589 RepID=A0A8K1FYC7_9PASS|nr:hypothetical protein HGM15179_018937 [Zosterops borbonicus]